MEVRPIEMTDDPVVRRLLWIGAGLLTLVPLVLALLLASDQGFASPHVLLHLLLVAAGLAAYLLLRVGRNRAAGIAIVGGYWMGVTFIAAVNGGWRGPNLINYPLVLVVAGWLLGTFPTLIFLLLTELVVLGFMAADLFQVIPPADYSNRTAYFVFLTGVNLMTAAATLLPRRGYLAQVETLRLARVDLEAREQELRRHREKLEEQVAQRTVELARARDAAEASNIAKTTFLANMSHEIRTPLNAITGMAHLIRRGGLPPQQLAWLGKLESAGEHLLNIVSAILDLSKIESGRLVLDEDQVDVDQILHSVAGMLTLQVQEKHLQMRVEPLRLPDRLLGDPTRLRQALLNYAEIGRAHV